MFSGFFIRTFIFLDSFFILTVSLKIIGSVVLLSGLVIFFSLIKLNFGLTLKSFFSDMFYIFWFSGWPFSFISKGWGFISSLELF
jgi:hypothetical protein